MTKYIAMEQCAQNLKDSVKMAREFCGPTAIRWFIDHMGLSINTEAIEPLEGEDKRKLEYAVRVMSMHGAGRYCLNLSIGEIAYSSTRTGEYEAFTLLPRNLADFEDWSYD